LNIWKLFYIFGWVTENDLEVAVNKGLITEDEKIRITTEP
jgi:hypothetical protein